MKVTMKLQFSLQSIEVSWNPSVYLLSYLFWLWWYEQVNLYEAWIWLYCRKKHVPRRIVRWYVNNFYYQQIAQKFHFSTYIRDYSKVFRHFIIGICREHCYTKDICISVARKDYNIRLFYVRSDAFIYWMWYMETYELPNSVVTILAQRSKLNFHERRSCRELFY